jgi:hypothetical protein
VLAVRAPERLYARFADADEPHLALRDELRHRADGIFDRHVRIDPMEVVDVDHVHPKALETRFTAFEYVFGTPVGGFAAVRQIDVAELARDERFAAPAFQRAAEQHLVPRAPVRVGAVEEIDPEIECALDRRVEVGFERIAETNRLRPAPVADRGDLRPAFPQPAIFHLVSIIRS